MVARARESERRLRDAYPRVLREAGIDAATVNTLMDAYDSPYVNSENPLSPAALLSSPPVSARAPSPAERARGPEA